MAIAGARKNEENHARMREHIIEAALVCIGRWGIAKTGMGDIAAEAGVVRTTVYNHFPQKQDVMQAAFLRVVQGFFDGMLQQVNRFGPVDERLVEAAFYICDNLPKDPYLSQILDPSMAVLANDAALSTDESVMMRETLLAQIVQDDPRYTAHIAELAEVTSRFILSLLLVRGSKKRNRKELREFIQRWLPPLLVVAKL